MAADGASERLRGLVDRRIRVEHLVRSAELARDHGLHTLKLYVMVGLPGEEAADIDELVVLVKELARIHPRVALGVSPFVAKRHTPLDGAAFAGVAGFNRIASVKRSSYSFRSSPFTLIGIVTEVAPAGIVSAAGTRS